MCRYKMVFKDRSDLITVKTKKGRCLHIFIKMSTKLDKIMAEARFQPGPRFEL